MQMTLTQQFARVCCLFREVLMKAQSGKNYPQPIIRWAGSKRKLLPTLVGNAPADFDRYVELFCGSACLFFALKPSQAILSDINDELINAYKEISNSPESIHSSLSLIKPSKEEYYRLRAEQPESMSKTERAIRFLFLNRYCFNGVYRTNLKGQFNVPMGSRTGSIPNKERFLEASSSLKKAKLYTKPYTEVISKITTNDFVYLDPPYFAEGRTITGEYGLNSFKPENINQLQEVLTEIDNKGAKFLLSYSANDDVKKIIQYDWDCIDLSVNRHIAGFSKHRKTAQEVLVANYQLSKI